MKNKAQIEQEVQKTLECFEQHTPIESNPFFATRVMASIRALEEKQHARALRTVFSLGFLRPALLTLIVVLNIVSAIIVFRGTQTQPQTQVREQYLTAFADEYALNQQDYDAVLVKK